MGVAASSFRRPKPGEVGRGEGGGVGTGSAFSDGELWITLKAKTTCKRTRAVKKKKLTFQPSSTGTSIGQGESCDFVLDDSNLSDVHALVEVTEDGAAILRTRGRTYYLIGQGVKSTGPHELEKDQVVKMGACSLQVTGTCATPRSSSESADALKKFAEPDEEDVGMCYICFDSESEPGNELVPSPCQCAKLVHRGCLSRWITTKGSRLCSICKSKLPIDFTVDAPYLVLQVVRHMRGLHWSGEREYIISFNQRRTNSVTVGSGADCDLSLPDPSLSRCHSRIEFKDGKFRVEDLTSSAGTFLKLTDIHPLRTDQVAMFKMGRTMLTVKVERRKAGLLRSFRAARKAKKAGADGVVGGGSGAGVGAGSGAGEGGGVTSAPSLAGLLSPTSVATGVPSGLNILSSPTGAFSPTSDGADSPVVAVGELDSPMHTNPPAPAAAPSTTAGGVSPIATDRSLDVSGGGGGQRADATVVSLFGSGEGDEGRELRDDDLESALAASLLTTGIPPSGADVEDIEEEHGGDGGGGDGDGDGASTGGGAGVEDVVSPMSGAMLSPSSAGPDM